MAEKIGFDDIEKAEHHDVTHDHHARHGDRALSLIGDERVTLTDEEVSIRAPEVYHGYGYTNIELRIE
jgi:hypothetical protein